MTTKIDLAQLRNWIGRSRHTEADMSLFPARAVAAALDSPGTPDPGDSLPPAWRWLYFPQPARAAATGTDGHPKGGEFLPPVPLPRRMWAAGTLELLSPLRIGRSARLTSTIQSVDVKSGGTGALIFVTLNHVVTQDQQLCIREEQNLVYRDMPTAPAPLSAGEAAAMGAQWTRTVNPDPVLLFRYSALTHNSHRIHYDLPYAMDQEYYPALVVHGPLLVTLLLELLREHIPEGAVSTCRFRAHRPTFSNVLCLLNGRRDGDTVHLWSTDSEGYLGMSVTVTLA
jgi:3-methylfumaryl-CoA hydratase